MDERDLQVFARFRRQTAVYVFGIAIVVSALVSLGVHAVLMTTYGRMIGSGLKGIVSAAGMPGTTPDDAQALASLSRSFSGLAEQGSFSCVTMVGRDGRMLASSEPTPCDCVTDEVGTARAAMADGSIRSEISKDDGGGRVLLVVTPLSEAPDKAPYAAVIASRPYGLIAASLYGTIGSIVVTVLLGAALAVGLVLRLSRRAEEEVMRREELVTALNRRLSGSLHDLERHSLGTLQALCAAVDAKDSYTAKHSLNVADYACEIARRMDREDLVPLLDRAGLLHDVGKIGIAEAVLSKPTRLSSDELSGVKEHSRLGAEIVAAIPFLSDVVPVVLHHHERFDGGGYPDGLAGDQIPLGARILAVADAFDAMTTERSYSDAKTVAEAVQELRRGSGEQFDPAVTDALVEALEHQAIRVRATRSVALSAG